MTNFTGKPVVAKQFISQQLDRLRLNKPLVVSITNYVVMNNTANALLAIGASPIMAHSRDEMAEMMSFTGSLVINIGTLDSIWIERMRFAITQANHYQKPIVIDPVGCGASKLRTTVAREFCDLADKLIVRGNASEIMALVGIDSQVKGVDAQDPSEAAMEAAHKVIAQYQANHVVISGAVDYVVHQQQTFQLSNGDKLMPQVTGIGCTHSALTGAFAAIDFDNAGLCATAVLGVAGELAAQQSTGPGSLQMHLFDKLYQLDQLALINTLKCQPYTGLTAL
ncbi:hydroxyethylthiazole kinase [Vibrio algicola]|uniref:Hydroxyethylthiazole kinase n=1 Tax=Vibrio algicola TaxID=2662262 RepID=A0A5Q0TFL0_9VIBR|nr:hydroxyethylthiazole kinase [Vibrio algicola]